MSQDITMSNQTRVESNENGQSQSTPTSFEQMSAILGSQLTTLVDAQTAQNSRLTDLEFRMHQIISHLEQNTTSAQPNADQSHHTANQSHQHQSQQHQSYPDQYHPQYPPPPVATFDLKRRDTLLRASPKFGGEGAQDLDLFISAFWRYCYSSRVSDPYEQFDLMIWSLRDAAARYIHSLNPVPDNVASLSEALMRRYGKTTQQRIDQFYRLRQRPGQSIVEFGDVLRTAATKTDLNELAIIHKFLSSLSNPRVLPYLSLQTFDTLEQAVQSAERISEVVKTNTQQNTNFTSYRTFGAASGTSSTATVAKRPVASTHGAKVCYICKKVGHVGRFCPKRDKTANFVEEEQTQDKCYQQDEGLGPSELVEEVQQGDEESECSIEEIECNMIEINKHAGKPQKFGDLNRLSAKETISQGNRPQLRITDNQGPRLKSHRPPPGAYLDSQPPRLSYPVPYERAPPSQMPKPRLNIPMFDQAGNNLQGSKFNGQNSSATSNPSKQFFQRRASTNIPTQLPSNSNGSVITPPSRPAVFPHKASRSKDFNSTQNQNGQRCLNTSVALPLAVQVGLMYLASNKPDRLTAQFKGKAREMLGELDLNQVEIQETSAQKPNSRQTLHVRILLNDKPCYAMIDTGAQVSLITDALANHLRLANRDTEINQASSDVVGVNGTRSSTVRMKVKLTIGNGNNKRSFLQRMYVIANPTYKILLGCDLLYFWGAEISIPRKMLAITKMPKINLPLITKDEVMLTQSYVDFIKNTTQNDMNLLELYEINAASIIANSVPATEQKYLGRELTEVKAKTTKCEGVMPTNSVVSYAPFNSLTDSLSMPELSIQDAKRFCNQNSLALGNLNTLRIRVYKLQRAIKEHPSLINPELGKTDQLAILQVLLDHADVFAFDMKDLQGTADFPDFVIDVTSKPIRSKPYRLTREDSDFVDKEVKALKEANMVEDSHSPWLSPTFVVHPNNHRARMVTDYRRVNAVTIKNAYPLPDILQLFDRLSSSTIFSTLDLKSGFYQIKVAPQSVPITAMGTDRGLYQFVVVPFGLCNAPSHFMHAINHVLQSDKLLDVCEAFVDDLVVHSQGIKQHIIDLANTLIALKRRNHKVAASKIYAGYTKIKLLGHIISEHSVSMDPDKISAISSLTAPTNLKELRAFLGMVGYYRRFIESFAKRSLHLTKLLKQDVSYCWSAECQSEFEDMKNALISYPVLALANRKGKFRLYTDFCSSAISAILQQLGEDGQERVVQYASKKCSNTESVLASAEGELLAVVFGLSKYRHYLAGQHFELITDSAAVTNLRTTRNLSAKLVRWSLLLADFDFTLIHKAGKKHLNADGLTRVATSASEHDAVLDHINCCETIDSESSDSDDDIEVFQCELLEEVQSLEKSICDTGLALETLTSICGICKSKSPRKQLLSCESCGKQYHPSCIEQSKPLHYWHCPTCITRINTQGMLDETEHESLQLYLLGKGNFTEQQLNQLRLLATQFEWKRGLLYKRNVHGDLRIFPGPARRMPLLDELHRRYLHLGMTRLTAIAEASYYWPNIRKDVESMVSHCLPCQLSNSVFRRRERLQGHLMPISAPRQGWSLDLAADLTTQGSAKSSILICVDDFTHYTKLAQVDRKSQTIANWVQQHILYEYGNPVYLRTDLGSEFKGELRQLCIKNGITQKFVERAAPWRNGRAERMVRTVKRMLTAVLTAREANDWPEILAHLQFVLNAAPSKGSQTSPFELFYGEKPPLLIHPHEISGEYKSLWSPEIVQGPENIQEILSQRREALSKLATSRLKEYHKQLEEQYAAHPVKDNILASTKDAILPNSFVSVKNTQRGAWQTSGIGPFLVVSGGEGNTVTLQSLTTGQIFTEARENILPLKLRFGARTKILNQLAH